MGGSVFRRNAGYAGDRYMSALQKQVAGDHYTGLKIQPIEYIYANGIGYMEGNVIKYITRHSTKNGADDILKAIHYCQLLLELHYGRKDENMHKMQTS